MTQAILGEYVVSQSLHNLTRLMMGRAHPTLIARVDELLAHSVVAQDSILVGRLEPSMSRAKPRDQKLGLHLHFPEFVNTPWRDKSIGGA
jgi:hypothetical protein